MYNITQYMNTTVYKPSESDLSALDFQSWMYAGWQVYPSTEHTVNNPLTTTDT